MNYKLLCWDPAHAVRSHFSNLNDLARSSAPVLSHAGEARLGWAGMGVPAAGTHGKSFRPQRLHKFHGHVFP